MNPPAARLLRLLRFDGHESRQSVWLSWEASLRPGSFWRLDGGLGGREDGWHGLAEMEHGILGAGRIRVGAEPVKAEAGKAGPVWYQLAEREAPERLGSRPGGLTEAEAAERLGRFGPNQLREAAPIHPWVIFARQFKSWLILLLIIAAIISFTIGEWIDSIAILAIVFLNAAIGFYQEFNAEKSIAALKQMTAPHATVRRDSQPRVIAASQVVPGDILLLEAGDLVAADARLLESNSLRCVESALTGESEAVEKRRAELGEVELPIGDRENMVHMGTHVAGGIGVGVVVATGMETELGRIAQLMTEASEGERTPLQDKLDHFGKILIVVALGIVALVFGLGVLRGMPWLELFMSSISLAVAAVPEGLPAVVTIALALGVMRMARRRALVRRLPAVETLGSTTVICSDKTGTLTVGEMTVRELFVAGELFQVTGEGYGPEGEVRFENGPVSPKQKEHLLDLATAMIGSNNATLTREEGRWKVVGDPTEGALLAAGAKAGASRELIEKELPKRHEIPFDSERKRRTVIRLLPGERLRAYVNGAPDVLLQYCTQIYATDGVRPLTAEDRAFITEANDGMAKRALRVLGSAYRDFTGGLPEPLEPGRVESDLVFIGLAGMYDPPRAEAKAAIGKCRDAGIRVVMITGDHQHTAAAVARELGVVDGAGPGSTVKAVALSGADLDRLSDQELDEQVTSVGVYARVTAAHKLRIVRAWKDHNAVVAMTGDGVNDAPAVKGADIGIAMGRTGTEVTKQAADMIITDDNFASIVAAVEEGRGIFRNIRKTLQFLLATNAGELLLMAAAVMLGLPLPLLPLHLLWINLITDGPPALALAADPIDKHVMQRPPRPTEEAISGGGFFRRVVFTGLITAIVALGVFYFQLRQGAIETARTLAFATLVFSQLLLALGFRSSIQPFWKNLFTGKVAITILLSIVLQAALLQSGIAAKILKSDVLSLATLLEVMAISAVPLACVELVKFIRSKIVVRMGSF